ncbi:uncharacterized protein J4E88_008407 [Alternaria novae-zelandiae]|uniref:uncharacterized protein n=1 Tax=Alternaria novae-zelandiae TaxID=430562 RepID=UPI0020C4E741|nr:uncharacterized protein J4E88_008407 [Alternaria novae-zelandiae]KAI4673940.1 hypothetical protein J4E88_008407 [Alternaria novae-zelandiae]
MALSALPPEILSRICRFIVAEGGTIVRYRYTLPQDLKSFRLSCKSFYQKTLFDVGVLHGAMLDHFVVGLTYKSLSVLYSISNVPYFRDRLRKIRFDRRFVGCFSGEEQTGFASSPEAVYMMTEIFKNLAHSTSLLNIYLDEEMNYPTILAALNLASFPHQIINVMVNPRDFRPFSHERFLNPLTESPHLISHLEFQATPHEDPEDVEPGERERDVARNEFGRHYSGYKPITPPLSQLAATLSGVERLTFNGCGNMPRLRLCHGCENIWAGIFAKNTYAHLAHLELRDGYVSGSRLRGFIKQHAGTLEHVKFEYMFLTDGTWRSIAQGLQKCSTLKHLDVGPDTTSGCYMGSLRQKHAAPPLEASLPKQYVTSRFNNSMKISDKPPNIRIILNNQEDITNWLDVFMRYFATEQGEEGRCYDRDGFTLPIYHEARTFFLPHHMKGKPDTRSRAKIALDKYLKADEGA